MRDKYYKKIELSTTSKIILSVVLVLVLVIAFFGGYLVKSLTIGSKKKSINWAIDMIDKYGCYYDEKSGEIKSYSADEYLQMIMDNLDIYSDYYTKEEFEAEMQTNMGNNYGVGLSFEFNSQDNQYVIKRIVGNSPAEKAGFQMDDVFYGVENNGETIVFRRDYSPINFIIENEEGKEYTYVVKRNGENLKIACKREIYKSNYVKYFDNEKSLTFVSQNDEPLEEKITDDGMSTLDKDTALIQLQLFQGNAVSGIERAMEYLKERNKTKLILDLRNNGGGDMNVLREVSSYFVHSEKSKTPLIVVAKDKQEKESNFYATGDNYNKDIKMVVLANESSASASECLIGAMLYYESITSETLVIEKRKNAKQEEVATTFGKGIMQTTFPRLTTGEAIKLTTAIVYQPDGKTTIHGKGITTTSENGMDKNQAVARAINILGND